MSRRGVRLQMICIIIALLILSITGCAGGGSNQGATGNNKSNTGEVEQSETKTNEAASTEETTPEPAEEEGIKLDTTLLKNDSGKTMIKLLTAAKEEARHASYAIVSSKGTVIVADPNFLPASEGLIKADIVTVSHTHQDHSDPQFLIPYLKNEVEGSRVSRYTAESFTVKDVTVTGIPSSHSSEYDPSNPTNMIYLYEIDGLRIAHFGDMAQTELTEEQIKAVGKLDVLITVFSDIGTYGFSQDKTVRVIEQLKPAIVMPGHYSTDVVDYVLEKVNIEDRSESDALYINREDMDGQSGQRFIILK